MLVPIIAEMHACMRVAQPATAHVCPCCPPIHSKPHWRVAYAAHWEDSPSHAALQTWGDRQAGSIRREGTSKLGGVIRYLLGMQGLAAAANAAGSGYWTEIEGKAADQCNLCMGRPCMRVKKVVGRVHCVRLLACAAATVYNFVRITSSTVKQLQRTEGAGQVTCSQSKNISAYRRPSSRVSLKSE